MIKKIAIIVSLLFCHNLYAQEVNRPFGSWLVSCKQNLMTAKNDCFIGTPFEGKEGRGAIVMTKYYLAVAHNDLNLSEGVEFTIDQNGKIASFMNNGLNAFFKSADRKILLQQMLDGRSLLIEIKGASAVEKSLEGFGEAYDFYVKQIN